MNGFVIAAGMMTVIHLVAGWLLYAVWERQVATGVLCDADCNIRVDLVFFFSILALATLSAYQAYNRT